MYIYLTAKKANFTKIAKCNLEIYSDKPVNISTCTDVQMYIASMFRSLHIK